MVSRRGPVYATRSRPALPKSSASLMAGRLNEAAATGYKSNNSTYFPWANGNGGFQVLPGHAGHAQGYYAVPTVAGPGNDRSHVAYASPSTLHLQTGKPRRSEVSVANTSKRLKKQQSSDQVYSVDSDDVEATSATAVQSSSSTTAIPSKEVSSPGKKAANVWFNREQLLSQTSSSKARAPSCDDKEGHYNIIPGQHIGPRNRCQLKFADRTRTAIY